MSYRRSFPAELSALDHSAPRGKRGSRRATRRLALLLALSAGTPAALARGAQADGQEIDQRIAALEAQVQQLKATQQAREKQREIDSATQQVQADAQRHSQLVADSNFTASYSVDRGFRLQSDDGAFALHPWFYTQFRETANYRSDSSATAGANTQDGFEFRRVIVGLDGNAVTPDLTYQLVFSVDRKSGTTGLIDAWARYHIPSTPISIRAGQIRDPLDHEQLVFGLFTLSADRSMVDDLFCNVDGLVQGVSVEYDEGGATRAALAVSDGMRSQNTDFQDYPTNPSDWGVSGRVEYKVMGDWKQYSDFTARGDDKDLLVFGAGADYTESGRAGQLLHVVDAQYENTSGLALYGAYLGRYVRSDGAAPGTNGASVSTGARPDTYDATLRAQAAYVIDGRWEPFVRYEYIHFDPRELPVGHAHSLVHEITTGVNYYFYGHHAKLTADFSYLPIGSPVSDDASGILASHGGSEFLVRAQFQLWL